MSTTAGFPEALPAVQDKGVYRNIPFQVDCVQQAGTGRLRGGEELGSHLPGDGKSPDDLTKVQEQVEFHTLAEADPGLD